MKKRDISVSVKWFYYSQIAISESIKIYLENEGYEVLTAANGLEALNIIEANEIHCLVLDIMMPVLDGLRTTVKIREKYNFPIIFLSC